MKEKPKLPDSMDWCEETIAWFEAWRNSPRTDGWDELQWQYLQDTAVLHNYVYLGNTTFFPELHKRLNYMGIEFEGKKAQVANRGKKTTLEVIKGKRDRRAKAAN